MKISALILTRNEEAMIADCLKQLDFADEIIVLDQSSTDKTLEITSKFTDKIYTTTSDDFAKNRNLLSSHAKGDWLIYIDADERLTPQLSAEIRQAIRNRRYSAYNIARKNFILGKWQKHGGWWPDYVKRLIRRNKLKGWHGRVHESPEVEGQIGYLQNPMSHLSARTITQMLSKSTNWAKIEAQLYHRSKNPKVTIPKIIKAAVGELLNRYILKLGILDGTVGLISAIYQSVHTAMIFTYLWEIQNDARAKFLKAKSA